MDNLVDISELVNEYANAYLSYINLQARCERYNKEIPVSDEILRLRKFLWSIKNTIIDTIWQINGVYGVEWAYKNFYNELSLRYGEVTTYIQRTKKKEVLVSKEDFFAFCHEEEIIKDLLPTLKKECEDIENTIYIINKTANIEDYIITMNGKYATSGLTIQQIYEKDAEWIEFIAKKSRSRHPDAEKIKKFYKEKSQ